MGIKKRKNEEMNSNLKIEYANQKKKMLRTNTEM